MIGRSWKLAAGWLALTAMQAPGPTATPRDWGATLRMDAQAIHDDLVANHPGSVNPADRGFAWRNHAQLRLALERARTAHNYADYFFALEAYVASFDDGHLDFGVFGHTPSDTHWPGFLTSYGADGAQRVATRADDAPVALGARLLACDGLSAARLAEANVGRFIGRWSLLSQRIMFGAMLFADQGNPYIRRPVRCTFDAGGRAVDVTLAWQPISNGALIGRLRQVTARRSRETAVRRLDDGTSWISLPSFNGDPQSAAGRALPPLIASLRADRAILTASPAIVLDLRGNDGGSSDWSRQIAELIWGRAALDRLTDSGARVDWRVSVANLASLRASRDRRIAGGALSPEARRWFDRVTTGLAEALVRRETLWREPADEGEAMPTPSMVRPDSAAGGLRGPVFLVTDASCASACLDAVDLWRALGAVHVGHTTSADTFYMDVRTQRLPSRLGEIAVPMKVYRGRPRGPNVPVVPLHQFWGDISDTAALEHWIAGLRERRR